MRKVGPIRFSSFGVKLSIFASVIELSYSDLGLSILVHSLEVTDESCLIELILENVLISQL